MKKVIRLTENDLVRLVKKIINENVDDEISKLGDQIEEKPISELMNKTVTFETKCGDIPEGKKEFGIKKATYLIMKSLDGTLRTITIYLYKLDDKDKNSFKALYSPGSKQFIINNFSSDNFSEKISLLCKGAVYGTSDKLMNYIKGLNKYPIGVYENEVLKSKTDF